MFPQWRNNRIASHIRLVRALIGRHRDAALLRSSAHRGWRAIGSNQANEHHCDCAATPQEAVRARTPSDGFDPVTDEVERWERLDPDLYSEFIDAGGLLNEFAMMWALLERFPLHFVVFKQTACHLPHEANVEMVFSRAGNLSDPNMDPEFLAHLVMVLINKKSYKPSIDAIKDKYFELFRGKGGEGQEADEGGASPSGSK